MRFILIFCVLLICGCQARHLDESPHTVVLKRVARQVMGIVKASEALEYMILNQCVRNGHSELQDDIQISYSKSRQCFMSQKVFTIPEEEYLYHVDKCAADVVDKSKMCLRDDQQYLPVFFLNATKSLISMFYRNRDIIPDWNVCFRKFVEPEVHITYEQCSTNYRSSKDIPYSLEDFCQNFIPGLECFPKTMEIHCEDTSAVRTFRQDYVAALTKYCN